MGSNRPIPMPMKYSPRLLVVLSLVCLLSRAQANQPVYARKAMVVAQEPLAAEVGLAVMKSGGNAVDGGGAGMCASVGGGGIGSHEIWRQCRRCGCGGRFCPFRDVSICRKHWRWRIHARSHGGWPHEVHRFS